MTTLSDSEHAVLTRPCHPDIHVRPQPHTRARRSHRCQLDRPHRHSTTGLCRVGLAGPPIPPPPIAIPAAPPGLNPIRRRLTLLIALVLVAVGLVAAAESEHLETPRLACSYVNGNPVNLADPDGHEPACSATLNYTCKGAAAQGRWSPNPTKYLSGDPSDYKAKSVDSGQTLTRKIDNGLKAMGRWVGDHKKDIARFAAETVVYAAAAAGTAAVLAAAGVCTAVTAGLCALGIVGTAGVVSGTTGYLAFADNPTGEGAAVSGGVSGAAALIGGPIGTRLARPLTTRLAEQRAAAAIAANSVRPAVADARLGRALADDFRGGPNPIGDGSALDAARHTVDTGQLVGGSTHLEKAVEMRDRYARILRRGGLNSADQAVARGRYDAYNSFVIENDLDTMMRARGLR